MGFIEQSNTKQNNCTSCTVGVRRAEKLGKGGGGVGKGERA
jgi:hypothetical protein